MPEEMWESAVIGLGEGQTAQVVWHPGRRLPAEFVPIAVQLGYSASEVTRYDVGELAEDMAVGDDIYLRGALVLPDEDGLPATLFGKPCCGNSQLWTATSWRRAWASRCW